MNMITYADVKKLVEEHDVEVVLERRGEEVFLKVEKEFDKPSGPKIDIELDSVSF